MTTGKDALHLLAFPLTAELHGTVHIRHLPERARETWNNLLDRYRETSGSEGNLPYVGLTTALRAITRTSVNLFPSSRNDPPRQLISRQRLDSRDIHDAVTLWEQVLLRVPEDKIGFSYLSELAELLANVTSTEVALADHVTLGGDQPDAPSWVYEAATWEVARQLAAKIWKVDGREVAFRADTRGNLLVWDTDLLWTGHWGDDPAQRRYAALQVGLSMKTLPWLHAPVLGGPDGVQVEPQARLRADRLARPEPSRESSPRT